MSFLLYMEWCHILHLQIAYHFSFSDWMFDFIFNFVSQLSSGLLPEVEVDSKQSDWPRPAVARRSMLRFSLAADEICALASQTWDQMQEKFDCGRVFFDGTFFQTVRLESVYPPDTWLDKVYVEEFGPGLAPMELLHDLVVFCNNRPAWTAFHLDCEPPLWTLGQWFSGRNIWFNVWIGQLVGDLCNRSTAPLLQGWCQRLREEGLPHGVECVVQSPGDVKNLPAGAAHAYLSDPGWTCMLIRRTHFEEAKAEAYIRSGVGGRKKTKHPGRRATKSLFGWKRKKTAPGS